MATYTKGVVATPCKDVFFVGDRLDRIFRHLIGPGFKAEGFRISAEERRFRLPELEIRPSSEAIEMAFTWQGEKRGMSVYFGTDTDHQDIAPATLTVMLGCWGSSEYLVKQALRSLSMLGDVYFQPNSDLEAPFEKLPIEPLTYLQACAERLEFPSTRSLGKWWQLWQQRLLRPATPEAVIGMSVPEIEEVLSMDYDSARARFNHLIQQRNAGDTQQLAC